MTDREHDPNELDPNEPNEQDPNEQDPRTQDPIRAPELTGATAWLNVAGELSLQALRGKIVLLDFWTYGCINCVHILPDLKRLEAKYHDELVVIGVHSAKFANEKITENLRRIVQRYDITHPVANDAEMRIWREYTVRAWPTQVLIDPAGYIVAGASGEGHAEQFDMAIAAVIQVFEERGELDRRPLPMLIAEAPVDTDMLRFPGKVLADPAGGRLFIADSNHHRILSCTIDPGDGRGDGRIARVVDIIGSGAPGHEDGDFENAAFRTPQGMALARVPRGDADAGGRTNVAGGGGAGVGVGGADTDATTSARTGASAEAGPEADVLYVADTGNHVIRAVDLSARTVDDAAGTGQQARQPRDGGGALTTSIASPWDVVMHGPLLLIAMAGSHQIWMLDARRGLMFPYAGSGREARLDGGVDDAAFAQPSGMALGTRIDGPAQGATQAATGSAGAAPAGIGNAATGQASAGRAGTGQVRAVLYVADSESNIIRAIDLPPINEVRTIAGGDLFDFGDVDGIGDAVRLQHPLGIACAADGRVFIADTYNHRIKLLNPTTGRVETFAGTGKSGNQDGPAARATFYEPGGLSIAGDRLYVADTNNHAIRLINLRTREVSTLKIEGLSR